MLKNAPHTAAVVTDDEWTHPVLAAGGGVPAAVGAARTSSGPRVGRIDNPYGDRNLICVCPPVEEYARAGLTADLEVRASAWAGREPT